MARQLGSKELNSSMLLRNSRIELTRNLEYYSSFYVGKDLVKEFDIHARNKIYDLEVVDIIVQVLANTISKTIVVADVRDNEGIIETSFSPREKSQDKVFIIRTGDHFNALEPQLVTAREVPQAEITGENDAEDDDCEPWGEGEPGEVQLKNGNFPYKNIFVSHNLV